MAKMAKQGTAPVSCALHAAISPLRYCAANDSIRLWTTTLSVLRERAESAQKRQ